jgi:uncharacterized protein YndB with AHSA1/START domain
MPAMARIRVSTLIDANPKNVWAAVEDIGSHVRWMADAERIRFRPGPRSGVGTTFECDTRVGPLRLTDLMEVTSWRPGRRMGVRHTGVVTGTGEFRLRRARGGRTRFTWSEELSFPWWMGGAVGAVAGQVALRWVWRRNLAGLKELVEKGAAQLGK